VRLYCFAPAFSTISSHYASSVRVVASKGRFGVSPQVALLLSQGSLVRKPTVFDPSYYEIGGDSIRIVSVVIVGVAVVVDIAEIVAVVVISRTLPPIR